MAGRSTIEFLAAYRRYTPEMADALMRISAALGAIRGARVLPAVSDELRASARVGTVHFSNLIEGNQLSVVEAERATRGDLAADSRAKIELVNYVEALNLIDQHIDAGALELTPEFLLALHGVTTAGLGRDDNPHFKPHHEGAWRDGHAVVFDHLTGTVMHEAPPPDQVESRMIGMFDWLHRRLAERDPSFVMAGVVHYGITDIHPFADGNGRVARLFQVAVLMHAGVLPGRMFSFERYYAEDRTAYYSALRSVKQRTLNMEWWLDYFLRGLAEEYERVASTVEDLSALMPGGSGPPLRLTPGQERAITALRIEGRREFSRQDYESIARVSRSAAGGDLRDLVSYGVLITRGAGRSTRYVISSATTPQREPVGRGRPARWTDTTIEAELRAFLDGKTSWPSPAEFRAAGKGALYTATAKHGGVGRWRKIVGL